MKNGFVKVAAITPRLRLADVRHNAEEMIRLIRLASEQGVALAVFPELALTGATCGDLFHSDVLISSAREQLFRFMEETKKLDTVAIVGLPIFHCNKLYNCAAVCLKGDLLGLIPKTHLSREEARTFSSGSSILPPERTLCCDCYPDSKQVFRVDVCPNFTFSVEIGDESASALAPSISHVEAGAHIICNPTAIAETVVSQEESRNTLLAHSARLNAAYVMASAGVCESTSDKVFGGYRLICENGTQLAESTPFSSDELLISEIDVDLLAHERRRNANRFGFTDTENYFQHELSMSYRDTSLTRPVDPSPFLPSDPAERAARCEKILQIQAHGLKERMERAYVKKAVLGISGGLDSTLALLAAVRAVDLLNRPRTDVLAVTMPCFGTTTRTKNNATMLCEELGVDFRCVNISASVTQHFADIGHDPEDRNVTYENCQARERTQVLMDIANDCGGFVVGTGDLSELALGWATYNGDHMSMYDVNAGIPKTLIRHVVAYSADQFEKQGDKKIAAALRDVLDTPVSPELLPAEENGEIAQKTEDLVGPYELHDFYLYHTVRHGFSPKKLYRLAKYALGSSYSDETILKWMEIFFRRFFAQQFKRSCLSEGPAIGSVSFSPRGAWSMPSDAASALWRAEIEDLKQAK